MRRIAGRLTHELRTSPDHSDPASDVVSRFGGDVRTYPIETIKIDRSFVQGLVGSADVLAVIHATINLVEHLGMASLVEGIEQEAQVSVLLSIGCRFGQGFLFSKPVAAERLVGSIMAKSERSKPAELRQSAAMFENYRGLMPGKAS